jgi:hypothetical protein
VEGDGLLRSFRTSAGCGIDSDFCILTSDF